MPYIVTVKLPKRKDHDPHNKVTGPCPVSFYGETCTDVTGEHHSVLMANEEAVQVFRDWGMHITRIEEVKV